MVNSGGKLYINIKLKAISSKIMMQEYMHSACLLYKVMVECHLPPPPDFEDLPYPWGRSYTIPPVFAPKWPQRMRPGAVIKSFGIKIERFRVSGKKNLEGLGGWQPSHPFVRQSLKNRSCYHKVITEAEALGFFVVVVLFFVLFSL